MVRMRENAGQTNSEYAVLVIVLRVNALIWKCTEFTIILIPKQQLVVLASK